VTTLPTKDLGPNSKKRCTRSRGIALGVFLIMLGMAGNGLGFALLNFGFISVEEHGVLFLPAFQSLPSIGIAAALAAVVLL
jgi:hypothetical protein